MFIKQRSNVIFRDYNSFGYVTDNRNFGYNKIKKDESFIGDKILSESGSVFFSVLDRKPQSLDELAKQINKEYPGLDHTSIMNDAKDFYSKLELDGFVVSGETKMECEEKDTKFSLLVLDPQLLENKKNQNTLYSQNSTQDFLDKHFKGEPQLTNLHVEITSKCNERCLHCYIRKHARNHPLNSIKRPYSLGIRLKSNNP